MNALSDVTVRDRALFFDGVLVLADLHVGRGAASNVDAPLDAGTEMIERFETLCEQFDPTEAVIAGDLLHSFETVPGPVEETLRGLRQTARTRDVQIAVTPGNHDTLLNAVWSGSTAAEIEHGETLICHGHVEPDADAKRYIVGHDHPTIEIEGQRRPCVLAGDRVYQDAHILMLPSFNRLVPGVSINQMSTADFMSPLVSDADALRPIVYDAASDETLQFPPLGQFRHRL